jgi:anhydro-N-acetylmuramic acid kinase
MAPRERLIAGIMSGTSADGIDVALVKLDPDDRPRCVASNEAPFGASLRERILALAEPGGGTTQDVARLHCQLATAYAHALHATLRVAGLERVDLIGCHGQTLAHLPHEGVTFQAGSGPALAALTGAPVVYDFRAGDIALGGQGAPLIPYVDWLLLRDLVREDTVASLNLGGIANVTILPAGLTSPRELVAFDTGPGNMVIDALAQRLLGATRDSDGALAAAGLSNDELLSELLTHPYFQRPLPKSAGREEFGAVFVDQLLERGAGLSAPDLLATATRLTAKSIANALFSLPAWTGQGALQRVERLLVAGGGARNPTLLRMLRDELPNVRVQVIDDIGWPADGKEAIGFALLADAAVRGLPAGLPNVTGASAALVLGAIAPGRPPHVWPDWMGQA